MNVYSYIMHLYARGCKQICTAYVHSCIPAHLLFFGVPLLAPMGGGGIVSFQGLHPDKFFAGVKHFRRKPTSMHNQDNRLGWRKLLQCLLMQLPLCSPLYVLQQLALLLLQIRNVILIPVDQIISCKAEEVGWAQPHSTTRIQRTG